jgi:nicotinamide riboside transporter PnuC
MEVKDQERENERVKKVRKDGPGQNLGLVTALVYALIIWSPSYYPEGFCTPYYFVPPK